MNEAEEKILDEYVLNYRVEAESYKMMGKMLNETLVNERLKAYTMSDIYIYGGTYLAVQLYRVIWPKVCVKGIVDQNARLAIDINVPIYTMEDFRKIYLDEKIIVTPPRYYKEIKKSLMQFVKEENIIFLGEFLEGFQKT